LAKAISATVHAQQNVRPGNRVLQNRADGVLRLIGQHRIQMMAVMVAGDQDRRLLARQARFCGLAAAFFLLCAASVARLFGLPDETFINLDDASKP
jgi:hypothetical protein